MAGKGDKPRSVDKKKYDRNYDKIFRKNKPTSSEKQEGQEEEP